MKKKRGRNVNIHISLSNRWLYTLIAIGLIAVFGVIVYAYGTSNPSTFGHSIGELAPPSECTSGQVLVWNQTSGWTCTDFPAGGDYCSDGTCEGNLDVSGTLTTGGYVKIGPSGPVTIGSSCSLSQQYELRRCEQGGYSQGFICICVIGRWRFITSGS